MTSFLIIFTITNFIIWLFSIYQTSFKRHPFHITPILAPLGIFVWGDGVIFGLFWTLASIICLTIQDYYLFGLIISVFWTIRGLGETIYWISEQFTTSHRNHPRTLIGSKIFPQDSIHFAYQIIAQTITIIAVISSIVFSHLWLTS